MTGLSNSTASLSSSPTSNIMSDLAATGFKLPGRSRRSNRAGFGRRPMRLMNKMMARFERMFDKMVGVMEKVIGKLNGGTSTTDAGSVSNTPEADVMGGVTADPTQVDPAQTDPSQVDTTQGEDKASVIDNLLQSLLGNIFDGGKDGNGGIFGSIGNIFGSILGGNESKEGGILSGAGNSLGNALGAVLKGASSLFSKLF